MHTRYLANLLALFFSCYNDNATHLVRLGSDLISIIIFYHYSWDYYCSLCL